MEPSVSDFTLPELGENITSGDVLRVLVKPGDTLAKDQPVIEIETDKATVEVPSSVTGRVTEVKVKAGDTIKVGQAILSVEDGTGAKAEPEVSRERPPAPAAPSVRRLARELGVDVNEIAGTGPEGRISIEDVKAHTKSVVEGPRRTDGAAATPLPDFSRWGEVERQPMRAV